MEADYCRKEERVNATTHGLGLLCALVGAVLVIGEAIEHGGTWQIIGCAIYAATLMAVYTASTLSHLFHRPRVRHAMRIADQAIIFLFIVGSYTAVAFTWFREGPWWILHVAMWIVALAGFTSKAILRHRVRLGTVTTWFYLLLGWMPMIAFWPITQRIPGELTAWLVAGGVSYTVGVVFLHYDHRVRYFHAVWHLMVIAGSTCHYLGVLLYCTKPVA